MTPPGRTRRLPGCGSAWKKPNSKICLSRIRAPVDGDLLRHGIHAADALQVVDRDALDELHGDHARRRQLLEDERNVGGRIVRELEPTALHGPALGREIELALDRALEFASQTERPVNGQVRQPAFDELGEVLDDVEVGLDDLGDVGPLHLQGDDPAVAQDRAVHLRDRGRGHRRLVERGEDLRRAAARIPRCRIASTWSNGNGRTSSRKAASSFV